MSKDIDKGDIIAKKLFAKPKTPNIDFEYDSYIRSELLADVIKKYVKNGKFDSKSQKSNEGEHILLFILY